MIHLTDHQLKIVKNILNKHVPNHSVLIFGSRIQDKCKHFSDLDLCIVGKEPLDLGLSARLREDFSQSDLPFRVDIVDWLSISSEFKKIIEKNNVDIRSI